MTCSCFTFNKYKLPISYIRKVKIVVVGLCIMKLHWCRIHITALRAFNVLKEALVWREFAEFSKSTQFAIPINETSSFETWAGFNSVLIWFHSKLIIWRRHILKSNQWVCARNDIETLKCRHLGYIFIYINLTLQFHVKSTR